MFLNFHTQQSSTVRLWCRYPRVWLLASWFVVHRSSWELLVNRHTFVQCMYWPAVSVLQVVWWFFQQVLHRSASNPPVPLPANTDRHCNDASADHWQFTSNSMHLTRVWLLTAPDRTGQHRTAPDYNGSVPGQKWLIILLWRLLLVELRCKREPLVLGLQLNKQELLNTSITNSSRASTRIHFFGQLRIISSSYAF